MAGLNLNPDQALLRGIENADAETIESLVATIRQMREPVRYSNQDCDRRQTAYGVLATLRAVGNTPILTHDQAVAKLAAERNAQFQAAQG